MTGYAQRVTSLRIKSPVNLQPGSQSGLQMNLIAGHQYCFVRILLNWVGAEDAHLQWRQPVGALAGRNSAVPGQRRAWAGLVFPLVWFGFLNANIGETSTNQCSCPRWAISTPSPTDSAAAGSSLWAASWETLELWGSCPLPEAFFDH